MAYYGFDRLANPVFSAFPESAWKQEEPQKIYQEGMEFRLKSLKVKHNPEFISVGDEIVVYERYPGQWGDGSWGMFNQRVRVTVAEISVELQEQYWEEKVLIENQVDPKKINFSTLRNCLPFLIVWIKDTEGDYYGTSEILGKVKDEEIPVKPKESWQSTASSDSLDF